MRIIPELPSQALSGILYRVPSDPKAQEEALKTLNVGKKTNYSNKEYIYFFKVPFESLIVMLENVWGNYTDKETEFVKIEACNLAFMFYDGKDDVKSDL